MAKTTGESKSRGSDDSEDRKPRNRYLVSLNDDASSILERLVSERGMFNTSAAIEFMLVNFGPWVLSADFIKVLSDTVNSNRLGGSDNPEA